MKSVSLARSPKNNINKVSLKYLGKGGISSVIKCPPLNWKVGCSINDR